MKKSFHFTFLVAIALVSLSFLTSCSGSDVSGSNPMVGSWALFEDGEHRIADGAEGAFDIFVFREKSYYGYSIHGRYDATRSVIADAYEDEFDRLGNEYTRDLSIKYKYKNGKILNAVYTRTITWEDNDHIILDSENSSDRQYWTRIKAVEDRIMD